jgi:hypothetical protein
MTSGGVIRTSITPDLVAPGRQAFLGSGRNWVRFARSASGAGPRRGELGSFCTFHSPAGPRPKRQTPLPTYPTPPKFGFVLHGFLRHRPWAGANWVRFARFTLAAARAGAKLGSFCTIALRPGIAARQPAPVFGRAGQIGFVSRICHPLGANWVRFARFTPRPGQIGFVLRICHPLGANWVRFARFPVGGV